MVVMGNRKKCTKSVHYEVGYVYVYIGKKGVGIW